MPPKKNRRNATANSEPKSGIVTRSQASDSVADMTNYTTLTNGAGSSGGEKGNNIQVISKSKLKSDPAHFAELVSHKNIFEKNDHFPIHLKLLGLYLASSLFTFTSCY